MKREPKITGRIEVHGYTLDISGQEEPEKISCSLCDEEVPWVKGPITNESSRILLDRVRCHAPACTKNNFYNRKQ